MRALGYDQATLNGVVQALLDTTARIRDPAGHDKVDKDGKEAPQFPSRMPAPATGGLQQEPTAIPEERADVMELVEAGVAELPNLPVSGSGDGAVGQEALLVDIASVEVGCCWWKGIISNCLLVLKGVFVGM